MSGSTRESAAGLRKRLDARRDDPGLPALPGELFAVADVLGRDPKLRSALADGGQPAEARVALARGLFGAQVSELTTEVVADVVDQKWPMPRDLVDAVEGLAAQAAFINATRAGESDQVEAELFTFSQAVDASADLQMALTDPAVAPAQKANLIASLLRGRMSSDTEQVLGYMMSHLRGRRVSSVLDGLMELAAEQQNRSVAEVRVARPLDPEQAVRLAAALSRLHGRDVRLNVALDPDVIGGIAVRIGDEVTDATVASRLEQARRALVG